MIKLPDLTTAPELKQLLAKMGIETIKPIPPIEFTQTKRVSRSVEVPNTDQLTVFHSLKRSTPIIVDPNNVEVNPDTTLSINGIKVCIYIKNQRHGIDLTQRTSTYKYHLCSCQTIQGMIAQGRKGRYVATAREDGVFEVNAQGYFAKAKGIDLTLKLCENCRQMLISKGLYFQPFTLKEFYRRYQPLIKETFQRTELVPVTEAYAPNHQEVANAYKEKVNYTCQNCAVCCAQHPEKKRLLHLHHKDGNGANNSHSNLLVLCVNCHEAVHPHMKGQHQYEKKILEQLYKDQGFARLML